ncbi:MULTISPECIES: hypothetical protein [Eisenbergiella]|uniref:Uncharacterized protein n=1 Tax=Eisenbergiella porci TaxID=2652274 RepID=A0A6N7WJ50_9FIRM|nr:MULTISPECIES: hypothetical protein [Eisenbergiella]MDY2651576.1 hypothetical protein [Eisenbergiella porci]MSS89785.1 hypothetical protein [Eisenbergiella porci]
MKVIRKEEQLALILTSDSFFGPYAVIQNGIRPLGMCMGDFDLVKLPDGRACCYFERVHKEIICAELTTDYTDVTGFYTAHFPHDNPPYVREAPAYFTKAFDSGEAYRKIKHNFEWSFSDDPELKSNINWSVPAPDTSLAGYVWLPVSFEQGLPVLHWYDEWRIENFE